MKSHALRIVVATAVTVGLQTLAFASGWNRSVTVTSIGENNVSGEVVQFTVSEVIDNSGHCSDITGYAIRDPTTIRGSLALLTSAMVARRVFGKLRRESMIGIKHLRSRLGEPRVAQPDR
jgi:hypothetical protein